MVVGNLSPMIIATFELFLFIVVGTLCFALLFSIINKRLTSVSPLREKTIKMLTIFLFLIVFLLFIDDIVSYLMRDMSRSDTLYEFEEYQELLRSVKQTVKGIRIFHIF